MPSAALKETPEAELPERPDEGLFVLRGGYVDGRGGLHREVQFAPLTGLDEEALAHAAPGTSAASAVTALLARTIERVGSIERVDAALVRDLLVCDRDYLVLRLRSYAFGPRVDAVLKCRGPGCGKLMDVRFSLDDLELESRPVRSRFFKTRLSTSAGAGGRGRPLVEFRLPTGADQEALAEVFRADEGRGLRLLLARTVRRVGARAESGEELIDRLSPSARAEVAEQMRRLTPHVEIEVEGACPECGVTCSSRFDIANFFLTEMRANLHGLEREVHFLALHYHWSEREILSLPRRKRQRYVALLRQELGTFE
jgi:hypothetical protein